MIEFMTDLDSLLGSSAGFLLGSWIGQARALATAAGHPEDADFLEWNARSQVFVPLPPHLRHRHSRLTHLTPIQKRLPLFTRLPITTMHGLCVHALSPACV